MSLARLAHPLRAFALVLAGVLALAACTTPEPVPEFKDLRFTNKGAITFRADEKVILSDFEPSFQTPFVEHLMPLPPERALRTWAEDRLAVTGTGGAADGSLRTLRFVIRDASVREERLETEEGIRGFLTDQQAWKYTAHVVAEVQVLSDRDVLATASTEAYRSKTLGEKASLNEREEMWYALVTALMQDFDAAMAQNIRTHLNDFTVNR
ncbi:Acyl-CoA synthetase [Caenispirillum salinarum AK4]|uniref:Acyl-CoA synthetase n=1 Tax=Caenispirillum salinarum AK4 TaxID=1238182 RepID=K9H2J0_9PROT|nr:hypothetical protein [Caenispirillum salinarum]EKV32475.1 Acyl-CoA synthetase [Caenispirillum salinarum AK4]